MNRKLAMAGLCIALAVSNISTVSAQENRPVMGDSGADMVLDLLLVRPIGAVGMVIGAAAWVVSLPLTVPTRSTLEVGREIVGKPFEYTFYRPLGDFHNCGALRTPCGGD